jgi:hypothetical protein
MSFEQPVRAQVVACDHTVVGSPDLEVFLPDSELPSAFLLSGWLTTPLLGDFGGCAPVNLLARVAERRQVPLPVLPLDKLLSLDALCALFGSGYTVPATDAQRHVFGNGPVLCTLTVTKCFLDFWSTLLKKRGTSPVFEPKRQHKELTTVVAIVGWEGEHWIVCNSWGASSGEEGAWGTNGLFKLPFGCKLLSDKWFVVGEGGTQSLERGLKAMVYRLGGGGERRRSSSIKLKGKTKLTLGHGENKANHPVKGKPPLEQWKDKLSKGDIASVTILGITCAFLIIVVCIVWSQNRRSKANKSS